MWRDVLGFLESARFDDVLLPGWVDRSGTLPVHRPLTFDVCLQADTGLIQLTSVNNNGGLHIRLVDAIEFDEALQDDPDQELAVSSVGTHFFNISAPVRCTTLRLFANSESVPGEGVFRAAEMTFEHASTVFFDPMWIDGVRLGTGDISDNWLADDRSPRGVKLYGPLKETSWAAQASTR